MTFADIQAAILHYNHEDVDHKDIQETLERFVSKRTNIQIYKNYVYPTHAFSDTLHIEEFYKQVRTREFYYPNTKPFFYYFEASYKSEITYPYEKNLFNFLEPFVPDKDRYEILTEVCEFIGYRFMLGALPSHVINDIQHAFNFEFYFEEADVFPLIGVLTDAYNHTRLYSLRGFTPTEVANGVTSKPYAY